MQIMCEQENTTKLSGRVEIDDAYLGGELPGGKVGRGSKNKVPFIAAEQTNDQNNPLYAVFSKVKSFSGNGVTAWTHRAFASATLVVSDGLGCFRSVTSADCQHQIEIVVTRKQGCFNENNHHTHHESGDRQKCERSPGYR